MYYNIDYDIMYSTEYVYIHTQHFHVIKIVFNLFRFYGHSLYTFNIDRL